ncbi:MAG: hypothetical protein Q7S20_01275 [Gemmatimonadaceae bacterium]|nr:hypothetical protein [Gemmatimonadaceae bacterium]
MTIPDMLLWLDVMYEVRVALAPDGEHLLVTGNADAIRCAAPKLSQMKPAILDHLRAVSRSPRTA